EKSVKLEAGIQDVQKNSESSGSTLEEKMVRSELVKEISMCVSLPIEVMSPDQEVFPFLKTTLADLGIDESAVKERVVLVDTKRTQVRSKSGKLKEKEVSVLEIRVKARVPGQSDCKEVLYSTESHTDRLYCRSGIFFVPWAHSDDHEPVELTLALEEQSHTTTEKKKSEDQI
ncbi:hypothetical protein C0J45_3370, partial [Silurus meridionalis]